MTFTRTLDLDLLNTAIKIFVGTHDFSSFKKNGSSSKNSVRTIYKAFVYQYRGKVILYFEADGYLRSQIRLMTGFLLAINDQILDIKRLKEQLSNITCHHRTAAPPNGLYLAKIKY